MYDAQFERIAARIDAIETILANLHDAGRGHGELALQLKTELATLEQRLEQIELFVSYEPRAAYEDS